MKIFFILTMSVLWSACNISEPIEKTVESLKKMMGMAFQSVGTSKPSSSVLNPDSASNVEAARTKANAQLLAEMIQITFNEKEIDDQPLFFSLVSSLNQGASLEGIYRGLVMGSRYRVLESKAKAASPDAIKFFAREMGELQISMKNPTLFTKDTAKEIPSIEYPDGSDSGPNSLSFGDSENKDPKKRTQQEITEEILQDFIGATPFTLKRVLAEEVLKKMDEMKDSPPDLSQWYAALVVRLSGANTDFGLAQRNSSDFDFHSKFARTMSMDRVKWEVLNRYHRVINRLN